MSKGSNRRPTNETLYRDNWSVIYDKDNKEKWGIENQQEKEKGKKTQTTTKPRGE